MTLQNAMACKGSAVVKQLSVKQNMLWNTAGSMVYLVCQWLITVFVVRLSDGYDAAGVLALGMAVSNIFSPIGYFKVRAFQVSDLNEEYSAGQYLAFRLLSTTVALACMIVYAAATCANDSIPAVVAYCVYSCVPIIADVYQGAVQQKNRLDVAGKDLTARGVLSLAVFCGGMAITHSLLVSLIMMTLVTGAVVLFYLPRSLKRVIGAYSIDFAKAKMVALFTACLPAAVALVFAGSIPSIPRQILGAMFGASALGAYASVASPVVVVQMGAQYIYSPLLSSFAQCYLAKDTSGFLRLFAKVFVAIIVLAVVSLVGFAWFGEWALCLIYGDSIRDYSYLLLPLVSCTICTAFLWFLGDLLVVVRDMKGNLACFSVAFVVCAVCSYPMLAVFGLNGASFATMAGLIAGSALCFVRLLLSMRS